jgi:sigma-E factor negative regulatory protein RseC
MNFQTSSLLKVTFMLYVLPVLFLILGAVIGQQLSAVIGQQLSAVIQISPSASSIIVGFLFFFAAVWVIKSKANKMAGQNQYQPKIIKILK